MALLLLEGVPLALSFGVSSQSDISQGPGDFTALGLVFMSILGLLFLHSMCNIGLELMTICLTSLEL